MIRFYWTLGLLYVDEFALHDLIKNKDHCGIWVREFELYIYWLIGTLFPIEMTDD